jgi:probable FeS assembly SUF system protein SufT
MYSREPVALTRETRAIQIPEGTPALLAEGERVLITQQLGGSYTVMTDRGALYRVDERDADSLGKEVAAEEEAATQSDLSLEDQVWAQLKKCYDPEIPVNIVDLGLIYNCEITDDGGSSVVDIKMTLTAPGCGMGPVLAQDVKNRVDGLRGVREAFVEVVFDPPWNQNMMTEAARLQLGFM